MNRVFTVLATVLFAGCAAVPDVAPPLDAGTPPLPIVTTRVAALVDGEVSTYAAYVGPLRVAELEYTLRRLDVDGRPMLVIDGITRMSGIAGIVARAGGTLRTVVDPTDFLPTTSMWTTATADPKSRAVAFDRRRAVAAAWTRDWIATARIPGERLLDPLSGVWVVRVLAPPPDAAEHRALVVEGTAVHLLTYRRIAAPDVPDADPVERWTIRSDDVDPETGRLRGTPPKTLVTVDVESVPPHRILRLEGRMAFGSVRARLETAADVRPSR